jgi:hypothetical protein
MTRIADDVIDKIESSQAVAVNIRDAKELIAEVRALRKVVRDIQHNAQVMNMAEPNRVWNAIDDQCRAILEGAK